MSVASVSLYLLAENWVNKCWELGVIFNSRLLRGATSDIVALRSAKDVKFVAMRQILGFLGHK